jgi:hypothetical protein
MAVFIHGGNINMPIYKRKLSPETENRGQSSDHAVHFPTPRNLKGEPPLK